ncbi:MAG: flagellar motor switch protein FliG [Clostridiales bacterium]|nr:MAG: flagellar motor switch protein FliG [Clostridiales bacterium]
MAKKNSLSGKEKAAVLLIAIGPDQSAKIFSHLKDEEIEELTLQIAGMAKVTSQEKEQVLEEFYQICLAQDFISEGGIEYAQEVLEKAMGAEKALEIVNKLTSSLQVRPFDFVRKADAMQLFNFIQNEHPQTMALILSYLTASQAATILASLPQDKQADVARRIAQMNVTSPEVIKEIESVLEYKLSSVVTQDYASAGGVQSVVDILNSVDRSTERHILESLEIQDQSLAEEIKNRMFVFEDVINLDPVAIQRFIREVENSDMALALKSATDEVKDAILDNMSSRMKEMLLEDIEYMGPVRLKDVEQAQQKIVNIIRKLEEAGEIILSRGGGDDIVV